MSTTTEPVEEQKLPDPDGDDERSTRRMLILLAWILGIAALLLLGLLFWLLRPEGTPTPPGQAAGYPIDVVTTIYGRGTQAGDLLSQPLGVAFDADGNVWISNSGRARVELYTNGGDYIRTIGDQPGDGELLSAYGLTVDDERDLVYVADLNAGLVKIYTTDGAYVGHLPSDQQERAVFGPDGFTPLDVKVSPEGRIVVSSSDGLYFFDQDGNVVARWGATKKGENQRGGADGAFNFPDAFTIDPQDGSFYVADTLNRRVTAIDADGHVRWISGTPDKDGESTSFWQLPRGIQIGTDGSLYMVDTFRFSPDGMGTGHIVVLSKDGELVSEFGRAGTDDGAFNFPEHLASGPDGLWAIADRENNRVVVFRLNTPYPEIDDLLARRFPETFSQPDDVSVTPAPTAEATGG
jgi:DNA-binding beta-propeller fold protein YncE